MAIRRFTFGSFLGRALLAALLVFATYNPSGYSYYHWLSDAIQNDSIEPLVTLAGIALLIGWVFFLLSLAPSVLRYYGVTDAPYKCHMTTIIVIVIILFLRCVT